MLKQIKGSGLLCGSNGQRQLSLIKVVGVQIIYALSSKADLSTHWLDYARPHPHSHICLSHTSSFHPILHFSFLHITHDDAVGRGEGGTFGHYRVCKAAEQLSSSLPAGYATRCSSSPEDFPICRRKCRFHLRRRWRRNSCERRLGILRVTCSISLQRIYGHSSSKRRWQRATGASARVALATLQLEPRRTNRTSVKSVYATQRQARSRSGSVRVATMSFVSLINCISIIISCSLTSPDTVRGSVTVSVTSTRSCSHCVLVRVLALVHVLVVVKQSLIRRTCVTQNRI